VAWCGALPPPNHRLQATPGSVGLVAGGTAVFPGAPEAER